MPLSPASWILCRVLVAMLLACLGAGVSVAGNIAASPAVPAASPHPPGSVPPALKAPVAASELWSLSPLRKTPLPPVSREGSAHLVDRYLDLRMAERGLEPAGPTSREALLRRLTWVLTGLPPTPEDTRAFVADESVEAEERLVDRLLMSPHFGERWARHWMDVVRYSESHGSQGDPELPMAWRYRDYLIRAFNRDVPYDVFLREQVAGDLLPTPRIDPVTRINESALGTGHLRMVELGYIPVDALDDQVKVVDNQVDVLSKAFLGLTVSCARCHDHKFDPISQQDFHAWYGILASARPGQVVVEEPGADDERLAAMAASKERIRDGLAGAWRESARLMASRWMQRVGAEEEREAITGRLKEAMEARRQIEETARRAWKRAGTGATAAEGAGEVPAPLARWTFESGLSDEVGSMHGRAEAGATVSGGRLRIGGGDAHVVTDPLPVDLVAMTLEVWVTLDDLKQRGGGVLTVQTPDSAVFDSIVIGEREVGRWMAGSDFFRRTQDVGGPSETNGPGALIHLVITHGEDGLITLYRNGVPYGTSYTPGPAHRYRAGTDRVVLGRRHLSPGVTAFQGEVEEARLHGRALTAREVSASFRAGFDRIPPGALSEAMSPSDRERFGDLSTRVKRWEGELAALQSRTTEDKAWGQTLAEAGKDPNHALHPWAMLRRVPSNSFLTEWQRLVSARQADHDAREAFNRTNFTVGWNLRGAGAGEWFTGGANVPARATAAGDFVVEPTGDRVVAGLMPSGVLSSTLTRKKPGVLFSPRFQITTPSISLRGLGSHANARVVIENYPIGNGGIYPARGLDRETPGWMRWDTAYRKGSSAYIEVVTSEDFASPGFRSGPRPYEDGRAGFAVAEVVFHEGAEVPKETMWSWRTLALKAAPRSAGELAEAMAAHVGRCVERWFRHEAGEDEVAFLDACIRSGVLPTAMGELGELRREVERFRGVEREVPVARRAPGMHEAGGQDFPLFQRGDPTRPGPMVARGFLSALGGGTYATRGSGRMELARDLSRPTNPLWARVMVNRIWHHVFGRGLVATPDNFGRLGVPPTHPELLDALAIRFMEDGGSVRGMVRLLVTSRAFGRTVVPPKGAEQKDPANDLLTHARVRRLDAESVRDTLMAVAGQLDLRMGGPGVNPYHTGKTEGGGPSGPLDGERRRSVYQRVRRNAHHPLLEVFDAPRASTPRGARDVTTVPAQSLAMLNDPFVREMASRWAARLVAEGLPRRDRVGEMVFTALGRPASEGEREAALAHLRELGEDRGVGDASLDRDPAVWADLAQSLFCLKEFIYVH